MRVLNYIFYFIFFVYTIIGCKSFDKLNLSASIENDVNEIFDSLVQIRRDIHRHPEIAGQELRTSKIIAEYLSDLGLEVKTGIAGNGVVGILRGNDQGANIAWRADMDALPNNLTDDVPFKSSYPGIQHGCGHDIHVAIGLGIANVLARHKEVIKGNIYFIFQPEEETFQGAKEMLADPLFSKLDIDEIYALHVTNFPVGQIMVKPNEVYAYQKRVQLTFDDKVSKQGVTELYNTIRNGLQRIKQGANPWEITKAFDTIDGLSNPKNIFSDYLFMTEGFSVEQVNDQLHLKAYLYETDRSKLPSILPSIEHVISNSVFKDNFISASFIQGNPTIQNDNLLSNEVFKILNGAHGEASAFIGYGQIPYFNDDFSYFQQKIPGVYFLLGASNLEKGLIAMNHAPNFRVDEQCISIGVQAFSTLLLSRVGSTIEVTEREIQSNNY